MGADRGDASGCGARSMPAQPALSSMPSTVTMHARAFNAADLRGSMRHRIIEDGKAVLLGRCAQCIGEGLSDVRRWAVGMTQSGGCSAWVE